MASISPTFSLAVFLAFLFFACPALSADSLANPPSISPSPSTFSPAPSPGPSIFSPPALPSPDLTPNSSSPAPSPYEGAAVHTMSPSPAPAVSGDVSHEQPKAADLETKEESSGGMNGGQKAGVAIGVIAGACVVGAGALVYMKRKQNIQRSQYGYNARREIL